MSKTLGLVAKDRAAPRIKQQQQLQPQCMGTWEATSTASGLNAAGAVCAWATGLVWALAASPLGQTAR